MPDNLGVRMRNLETQVGEMRVQQENHCEENNVHFSRIEKTLDNVSIKIDKFSDVANSKADRAELHEVANAKANKDDLKELRNWVVGGILISILLMTISIMLRK